MLNVRYLSGFTGSFAMLIITDDSAVLITDSRYTEQASAESSCCTIELLEMHWLSAIKRVMERLGLDSIGFESGHVTFANWQSLTSTISDIKFIPMSHVVENMRMVKDEGELKAIRQAARITDLTCRHILNTLRTGMNESEIALEIDFHMRKQGAEKEGFETIVISGKKSALPHGKPSAQSISAGEFILMDFGARWQGYHGDITRTVILGEADSKHQEIYDIVLEAQTRSISAVRPGVTGGEIDAIAREYISSKGYGPNFGHGLGHGLGLSIHDDRALARDSDILLKPGMVVTVEPGIYIPDWGGVRIEDDVLITNTGHEVLTTCPKQLVAGERHS